MAGGHHELSRRLVQAARDFAGDTERAADVTKRNLSLKVKGPRLAKRCLAGDPADRKLLYRGRARQSLSAGHSTGPREMVMWLSSLPRLAPAFVTAVSEARTAATVHRGGQGGSRRCLAAPTPPVSPIASKRPDPVARLTARILRERTNLQRNGLRDRNWKPAWTARAGNPSRSASFVGMCGASVATRKDGSEMGPYAILGSSVGTAEAAALCVRLTAWHDAMVAHERRLRTGRRADACDDECPHDEARTLWARRWRRLAREPAS